jgi:hypothetical protein
MCGTALVQRMLTGGRMVRRNTPNPFAGLSDAQVRQLAAQVRQALHEVKAAGGAVQPLHPNYTGTHSHKHPDYDGGAHLHEHEHDGDSDHDHVHAGGAASRAGGQYRKHIRFTGGEAVTMSAARRSRLDASWAQALKDAQDLQAGWPGR